MTLRLGGDGAITGCTSLENPDLTVSGLTISGSFDAEKVLVASGTAAAPSYTFSGDTDNGLYYAGTNSIGLSTAGTNAILIDSSGKVGIGTTSPDDTLHIVGSTGYGLKNTDGTHTVVLRTVSGGGILKTASNHTLVFGTNDTERMRIDSSGKVGIGTTLPGNNNLRVLQPIGDQSGGAAIKAVGTAYGTNKAIHAYIASVNADRSLIYAENQNGVVMNVNAAGNVGINESTPDSKLDIVYSTTSDATTQKLIHLRTDGTAGYASRGLFVKIGREGAYDNSAAHYDIVGSAGNSGTHIFENNGSESMRIDSSGFVGIGGTPNGSAGYGSLSLNGSSGTQSGYLAFIDSSGNLDARIFVDNTVMNIQADPGSATSGSAIAFRTDSSEAMRIDSSGRLLVGTTTARVTGTVNWLSQIEGGALTGLGITTNANSTAGAYISLAKTRGATLGSSTIVNNNDVLGAVLFSGADGVDANTQAAYITCNVDGTPGANDMPGRLVFSTTADGAGSPTERMRITSQGFIKASNTGSYVTNTSGTSATQHEISNSTVGRDVIQFYNTSSNPYGIFLRFSNATPNNTLNYFLYCMDSTGQRVTLRSNGGIANYQSNNVNLCDEREKKNIETLDSTWGCLKEWELKKFHYNEDDDADDKRYGVIAQQVAPHCPEVITDWVKQKAEDTVLDEEGNIVTPGKEEIVRIGVKEQQMMWMAIKALQEAQTRIETLEAEVAALKAQ